ncbi:MAG: hypothetical protein BRC38_08305 [Cyanobacteria bacterium QH_6_48_35]|nr:MAG: hypothetical protein BRC35_08410 [Cyanobacteria bacterium QH_10_48_56]PSO65551.1 MAG: hypothetical protein BRC38_08305 [Cyanobacteria bacterium QH_6_48_35]
MTTVFNTEIAESPPKATTPAAQAPTRSGPRPVACAVVAQDRSGANPAGTGALDGLQRVQSLALILALPAARTGETAATPLAAGSA